METNGIAKANSKKHRLNLHQGNVIISTACWLWYNTTGEGEGSTLSMLQLVKHEVADSQRGNFKAFLKYQPYVCCLPIICAYLGPP